MEYFNAAIDKVDNNGSIVTHSRDTFGHAGKERVEFGGEFALEFEEVLRQRGIMRGFSLPGRPSTNSRIEDRVRRILEGTRATMLVAGVVYSFWGYAVVMTAKNISLMKILVLLNMHYHTLGTLSVSVFLTCILFS